MIECLYNIHPNYPEIQQCYLFFPAILIEAVSEQLYLLEDGLKMDFATQRRATNYLLVQIIICG